MALINRPRVIAMRDRKMCGFTRSKRNTKGGAKIMIFAKIESYRIHSVIIRDYSTCGRL